MDKPLYKPFKSKKAGKKYSKGIKKKDGSLAWKDKNSPNYWSVRWSW